MKYSEMKPVNLSAQVGPIIRAELARRGLTQAALAQHLGISAAGVSDRLRGVTPWDVNELHTVAQVFDLPMRDLLPESAA